MRGQGEIAALRVGYHVACRLRDWSLTASNITLGPPQIIVTGVATNVDTLWISQGPTDLGLWLDGIWWVFERVQLERSTVVRGGKVTVTARGRESHHTVNFAPGLIEGR